ncbi:MAG: exodeoxyribonuclease VII small subunit [Desulforegulaceae bacterium]|jgi:exodeoxyribonuclease VII small subunit|nr:exodeoxyribonuclease VII small subunit [Desulforegulaceae bacterium]
MAKKTFEEALKKLDEIVDSLEDGNLSLEDAVKRFEEGIKLSKFCEEKLNEAEEKILVLKNDINGNLTKEPAENLFFSDSDEDDE